MVHVVVGGREGRMPLREGGLHGHGVEDRHDEEVEEGVGCRSQEAVVVESRRNQDGRGLGSGRRNLVRRGDVLRGVVAHRTLVVGVAYDDVVVGHRIQVEVEEVGDGVHEVAAGDICI